MQERYLFPETETLPRPEQLAGLLREYREVGIRYTALPQGYLDALSGTLENHTIQDRNSRLGGVIVIIPAVSTASILARKDAVYACAKVFRQQAFQLMNPLLEALAIPPDKRNDWRELMQTKMAHIRRGQARGQLGAEWTYFLHGFECRFENGKTGQVVEVIINNCPEFGCLDAWFFLQYINTTEQFAGLREWLGNEYENAKKVLTILARQDVLKHYGSARDDRNLFAD
ncbi:hypothetical protein E5K00_05725 [Hymenobacter aquaticus]|uniref:DUF6896 domain-containing protein n=1 Tax=Hymenobacter aquaticus TaxID=1867101 RepID=A0A4Z0Q3Q0_9BACT|nr:hypothetical protein [Hymenobacter aquaticus]TGE24708.1 hypothetical protein E5K00_05725 [Hymenobacter aquaticus]